VVDVPRGIINVVPGEDEMAASIYDFLIPTRLPLAPEPGGDACFWGLVDGKPAFIGVERKRADNLISSWKSGEMADQLRRMAAPYDIVILLIERQRLEAVGTARHILAQWGPAISELKIYDYSFDALMNDLQTWQDAGLRVQSCGVGDAGRRVWSLFQYYQKPHHEATSRGRLKTSSDTHLLTTPGLGPKRHESMLRKLAKLRGSKPIIQQVLGTGKVSKEFLKRLKTGARKWTWWRLQ
jgi:hypothetical protein